MGKADTISLINILPICSVNSVLDPSVPMGLHAAVDLAVAEGHFRTIM